MDPHNARPPLDDETLRRAREVFHWVRSGDLAALLPLLDQGLPPNLRNENGDSLLMLAAYHGQPAVVAALLQVGADPQLCNDRGQTPLAGAAFKGAADVVRTLLEGGAAVDGTGPDGRTALMTAAMFNRLEIIELLLAHGADPARRDAAGLDAATAARTMGAIDAAARLGA
jgi:ankyrin repeat protein